MESIRTVTDPDEAETLWRAHIPRETVFDLWEVRAAFHRHYQRPFRFLVGNTTGEESLFLPLSWVEEKQAWCFFPGETWSGKTWLEQNRLYCGSLDVSRLGRVLEADFHLRYVKPLREVPGTLPIDEIGYLFHPPLYRYNIENWWALFPRKKEKSLRRELAVLAAMGTAIRHTEEDYFDRMVEMSLNRFGASSYFADMRFREGFRDMVASLSGMGALRVTTIHIDGTLAAVDFGSVYRGRYTLLAGSTDPEFTGSAKLINLYHMEWACRSGLDEVDFLCGDFSWKPLFKLEPRPLYLFTSLQNLRHDTFR